MATRFDGSDIASVSVERTRLVGTRWCFCDQRRRDDAEDLARDVQRQRVDDRQAVLALEVGEELLLGDEAELDEVRGERAAVLALLPRAPCASCSAVRSPRRWRRSPSRELMTSEGGERGR